VLRIHFGHFLLWGFWWLMMGVLVVLVLVGVGASAEGEEELICCWPEVA